MAVKKRTTYTPPKTATTLSFHKLEELWIGAGGNKTEAPYAAAIALAESKGNPTAEGHNTNGTIDRGLWQINSVHGALSTFNVAENAKAAVQIAKESGGFGPWVTYKTGAYEAYLTPANLASGVKDGEAIEPLSTFDPETVLPEEAAKAAAKAFESLFGKFGNLVVNGVLLLAGAVLVVYGIMVAVRPSESALSLPKEIPIPVPV